jgi:galactose oxidase
MHVVPDGRVFMSGPLALTQFLDTGNASNWTFLVNGDFNKSLQNNVTCDYAPSVMFDVGKILFIGGGQPPTRAAEVLDLTITAGPKVWPKTSDMHFPRRQHNATLLPDGTVLVTGGTQGSGGISNGFNDLTPGQPIRAAELWDPKTGQWTILAEESVDRCYHSTAVLLPDATVLSAGGGEYRPINGLNVENPETDSHRDAQIFKPPYLFRNGGARPVITSAPTNVTYRQVFTVNTPNPSLITQVSWIRLSSVTHSFNQNQRINFLKSTKSTVTDLSVTAPDNSRVCPPGHYMLFLLDKRKVPSVAQIIQIQ